jgi:transporter family-2 protein
MDFTRGSQLFSDICGPPQVLRSLRNQAFLFWSANVVVLRSDRSHPLNTSHFPKHLQISFNNRETEMRSDKMSGILFAFLAGAFITLQGVANSRIGQDIGTWQAATVTQLTGFLMAMLILLFVRDRKLQMFKQVKPIYLTGGAFAAVIISSNITAIHHIGATLTIAVVLIAQLSLTFFIDIKGWFGVVKMKMRLPQFIGIAIMIAGVMILRL